MEQLLLHLLGDYIIQTDHQAINKTKNTKIALLHAITYTIPFLLITTNIYTLLVICITHCIIDRYRLARYVIYYKNKLNDFSLKWEDCEQTGFHKDRPIWLTVWLLIITDNTIHLIINYLTLKYIGL